MAWQFWKNKKAHDQGGIGIEKKRIKYSEALHMGRRQNQEDYIGIIDRDGKDISADFTAALSDGIGGNPGGEVASSMAVKSILDSLSSLKEIDGSQDYIMNELTRISKDIHDHGIKAGELAGMGATLVAAVIKDDRLYWWSVGDSRIFLLRDKILKPLNVLHNFMLVLEEEIKYGYMTMEDVKEHPDRDLIISYMGQEDLSMVDFSEEPVRLCHGDRILICSDGVFNTLNDGTMARILETSDIEDAADEFIRKIIDIDSKYQDNASLIVVEYDGNN